MRIYDSEAVRVMKINVEGIKRSKEKDRRRPIDGILQCDIKIAS